MDTTFWTVAWVVVGAALIVGEFALPGLIVVFPGAAALVVGGLVWAGVLHSVVACVVVWAVLSVVLLLGLRRWLLTYFPADSQYQPHNPDAEAYGKVVEVIEDIPGGTTPGRIRHEGTTWEAVSRSGPVPAGSRARLLFRENLVWVVEPAPPSTDPPTKS